MKTSYARVALAVFIVLLATLACSAVERISLTGPTSIPKSTSTPTLLPPPPTLTPSPLPPTEVPTATPLPAARVDSGDRARFEGDWQRAEQEYRTASQSDVDAGVKSAALLGLGRNYLLAGQPQAALEVLDQLIAIYPNSSHVPYAHFARGQAYTALGRNVEAADAYLNYLVLRPGVADAYVLNLRGDALAAAGNYGEALIDYRGALQAPGFLDGTQLQIKIARAHAAVGDYPTALGLYQEIYNQTSDDYTKAAMDLLMGQAYTAQGMLDLAYAAYQDAVSSYPLAYDSYTALLALVEAGVPVDELNRGIVDYYAGQYGVAIAAFDRYLSSGGADPAAAHYYYGLSLRALGGSSEAITHWDVVIMDFVEHRFWDDAWEQKAYTQWAFLEDHPAAVQTLQDFVKTSPGHPRAGEFLFDAAQAAERAGNFALAADLWERVMAEYPGYNQALRALYLAGISRYRLDDFAAAYLVFQRVLESAETMEQRTAAYLWMGKCRSAQGDAAAARASWELAAGLDPTGYYSERARDILLNRLPFTPPGQFDLSFDLAAERAQAEIWLRATFNIAPDVDLATPAGLITDPRFQRGSELWELGLYDLARLEFEDLRLAVQDDPSANFRLANYMLELGSYRQAILASRQVLNLAGMSDADTLSAPVYFNHIRFGTYYRDLILPAAARYQIHPLMLFSVVRQESAFEGFVRSSAGARGLMQIVPATGAEIVSTLGWPENYSDDDLYRPLVSINLGTEYLAKWYKYFAGSEGSADPTAWYAALAAYNGGPGNAIAWLELSDGDPDLLLEVVRFEETRAIISAASPKYSACTGASTTVHREPTTTGSSSGKRSPSPQRLVGR